MLQIKIVQNQIFYKKLSRRIYLSSWGVELGSSKDYHFWNTYYNAQEWQVGSLKAWTLPTIQILSKNTSNKSRSELNLL